MGLSLTDWLAIIGALTGTLGFAWQVASHQLTGGRIRLHAQRNWEEGEWKVRTWITNTGRLPVLVENFEVSAKLKGHYSFRLKYRLRRVRHYGPRVMLGRLAYPPRFTFYSPSGYADDEWEAQLPISLSPGQVVILPKFGISWQPIEERPLIVSADLSNGRRISTKVIDSDARNRALDINIQDGHPFTIHTVLMWDRHRGEETRRSVELRRTGRSITRTVRALVELTEASPGAVDVEGPHNVLTTISEAQQRQSIWEMGNLSITQGILSILLTMRDLDSAVHNLCRQGISQIDLYRELIEVPSPRNPSSDHTADSPSPRPPSSRQEPAGD